MYVNVSPKEWLPKKDIVFFLLLRRSILQVFFRIKGNTGLHLTMDP